MRDIEIGAGVRIGTAFAGFLLPTHTHPIHMMYLGPILPLGLAQLKPLLAVGFLECEKLTAVHQYACNTTSTTLLTISHFPSTHYPPSGRRPHCCRRRCPCFGLDPLGRRDRQCPCVAEAEAEPGEEELQNQGLPVCLGGGESIVRPVSKGVKSESRSKKKTEPEQIPCACFSTCSENIRPTRCSLDIQGKGLKSLFK